MSAGGKTRGMVVGRWVSTMGSAEKSNESLFPKLAGLHHPIAQPGGLCRGCDVECQARRFVDDYERERQLIAYEIHDGLVQDITAAQMRLQALLHGDSLKDSAVRREAQRVLDLLQNSLEEARNLIRGLRPPVLDEWGVVAAVGYLIEDQSPEEPAIEFVSDVPPVRMEPLLETTIYRIVQEGLANVNRHSKSSRALIRLTYRNDRIHLEIRDWGIGFNPAKVGRRRFGLEGIRERARLLHGWASIESAPGQGTQILVDLPAPCVSEGQELVNTNDRSFE